MLAFAEAGEVSGAYLYSEASMRKYGNAMNRLGWFAHSTDGGKTWLIWDQGNSIPDEMRAMGPWKTEGEAKAKGESEAMEILESESMKGSAMPDPIKPEDKDADSVKAAAEPETKPDDAVKLAADRR